MQQRFDVPQIFHRHQSVCLDGLNEPIAKATLLWLAEIQAGFKITGSVACNNMCEQIRYDFEILYFFKFHSLIKNLIIVKGIYKQTYFNLSHKHNMRFPIIPTLDFRLNFGIILCT